MVLNEFNFERVLGEGGFGTVGLLRSVRSGERFAVKRARITDPVGRALFLDELRNWINLPAHPHLVACRFFRTVGEEIAIFAEYVPGGSLHDWLHDGRLYDGGTGPALARVLDIAIQAAWGLHAAHQRGLAHQDVKPSNVMLTDDGTAKIADFGLAAGRHQTTSAFEEEMLLDYLIQDIHDDGTGRPDLVKAKLREAMNGGEDQANQAEHTTVFPGGKRYTPAYASPEQIEGRELNRRTDTWSWGVTVLEMFTGQVTWPSGSVADAALEDVLDAASAGQLALPLGDVVAEVLRRCFRDETSERWPSMDQAAEVLQHVYSGVTGHEYPRQPPREPNQANTKAVLHARRHVIGPAWSDPGSWLQLAYQATGADPATIGEHWPLRMGNRRAMALADLAAMEEARRRLETVAAGNPDLTDQLGILCGHIALILSSLGDSPGAIREYERCVAVFGSLDGINAARSSAIALNWLAIELRNAGRIAESIAASDRCIGLCEELARMGNADFRSTLANALLTKGNTLTDRRSALEHYERAIQNLDGLDEPEALAKVLASKATAQQDVGDTEAAKTTWVSADAMLARLIEGGRTDLRIVLARTRLNRSIMASDLSEKLRFASESIDILTPLVAEEGRAELTGELGQAYFYAGMSLEFLSRVREALDAYSQSSRWLSAAVLEEGQSELVDDLARSLDYESTLARSLGDPEIAITLSRRAVKLWENLVQVEGADTQGLHLADALCKLGTNLGVTGQLDEAVAVLERSIQLYREHGGDLSVEIQTKYAAAVMERAVVFRTVRDLESAIQCHSEAFELVRSFDDSQARHMAALISMNLSNALNDAGDYGQSLSWIDEAITRWEALIEAGEVNRRDDLIAALQNRFNKLHRLGMLEEACATADRVLPMYERLVSEEGRDDLAFDMGRLLFAVGYAYRNLFRPEEALPYFERGLSLLETARLGVDFRQIKEYSETLTRMIRELRELLAVKPADFERWIVKAREQAELAQRLGQMGETTHAQQILHEAVSIVVHLGRVSGEPRFLEDAVRWSLSEGVVAMHARLTPASESAFRFALSLADQLLTTQPRPDLIEDLAKAYLGLASLFQIEGQDDDAQTVAREMEARLETLDPRQRLRWSEMADRSLTEIRKLRDTG
jgi:serine/threonine protein kinase/tetratricopeptide (TPR) repeat protein